MSSSEHSVLGLGVLYFGATHGVWSIYLYKEGVVTRDEMSCMVRKLEMLHHDLGQPSK